MRVDSIIRVPCPSHIPHKVRATMYYSLSTSMPTKMIDGSPTSIHDHVAFPKKRLFRSARHLPPFCRCLSVANKVPEQGTIGPYWCRLRHFYAYPVRIITVACGESSNHSMNLNSDALERRQISFSFCFGVGFGGACAEEWINTVVTRVDCRIRNYILFTKAGIFYWKAQVRFTRV
jgi:hypothetical protein